MGYNQSITILLTAYLPIELQVANFINGKGVGLGIDTVVIVIG